MIIRQFLHQDPVGISYLFGCGGRAAGAVVEPGARVDKVSGRSVDYAERIGAQVIIRSLRAVTDFDYELQMAQMNKQMKATIETVFLFANPKLFFSASRLIKEVAGYGKRLPELVPEAVMNRLRAKLKVD